MKKVVPFYLNRRKSFLFFFPLVSRASLVKGPSVSYIEETTKKNTCSSSPSSPQEMDIIEIPWLAAHWRPTRPIKVWVKLIGGRLGSFLHFPPPVDFVEPVLVVRFQWVNWLLLLLNFVIIAYWSSAWVPRALSWKETTCLLSHTMLCSRRSWFLRIYIYIHS